METDIKKYIVPGRRIEWAPLVEAGVDTEGIFVKTLRYDVFCFFRFPKR